MSDTEISAEELHVLRHSLGVGENGKNRSYRNRYVCDPEPLIDGLVVKGLMTDHGAYPSLYGGMHAYTVTDAGIKLATK